MCLLLDAGREVAGSGGHGGAATCEDDGCAGDSDDDGGPAAPGRGPLPRRLIAAGLITPG